MVMCCPLQDCDERADIFNVEHRVARKDHTCCECLNVISKGTLHEYISMFYDKQWSTVRQCLLCSEIGDHFSCGRGRIMETLWSDLEDKFFRDMSAGGECMQGLSPAAKQKLIDRRMKWYFDQDEVNDDAWEFWPLHRDRQRPLRAPIIEPEPRPPAYRDYYDTPEYHWKRELELDQFREPDEEAIAFWRALDGVRKAPTT